MQRAMSSGHLDADIPAALMPQRRHLLVRLEA